MVYAVKYEFFLGMDLYIGELTKFYPGLPMEEWANQVIKPNIHSFVFLKSKREVEGVIIEDGVNNDDLVDFEENSQMIISYNSISNLLKHGDVHLI